MLSAADTLRAYRSLDELPPLTDFERFLAADTYGEPAVFLISTGYKWDSWTETRFTVVKRAKILSAEGCEYASVSFRIRPEESADDIAGRTRLPDGSISELDPEQVAISASYEGLWGPEFIYSFSLPEAQPGAVIEYTYTVVTQLGAGLRFNNWFLQDWVTILHSRYTLDTPASFMPFTSNLQNYHSSATPEIEDEGGRRLTTYTFADLPGIKHEPLMPPASAILACLIVDYRWRNSPNEDPVRYWTQLGHDIAARAEQFISEREEVTNLVRKILPEGAGAAVVAETATEWIQSNITNLSAVNPDSLYRDDWLAHEENKCVDNVLENGYGSPLDITLLALAMLRAAGVDAHLALSVNRKFGILSPYLLDPHQLDQPLLTLSLPDGRMLFLQPAVHNCPSLGVAWWVQGTVALVCKPGGGDFVRVPVDQPQANLMDFHVDLSLDSKGDAAGSVTITISGQQKMILKEALAPLSAAARIEYVSSWSLARLRHAEPGKIEVLNPGDADEALQIKLELLITDFADRRGKILEFAPGSLVRSNEPELSSVRRLYPIQFPFPATTRIRVAISLPPGYSAEAPDSASYSSEIGSYTISCRTAPGKMEWYREMVKNKIFFRRSEYVDVSMFQQYALEGDLAVVRASPGQ